MLRSMLRYVWLCAIIVASAGLGCGESHEGGRDGGASDAGAVVCEGDHWGASETTIGAIARCTTITGNLSITSDRSSIELPNLERIDGFLVVWSNPMLTHLALMRLTRVGDHIDVSYNNALTSLALPALEKVNEHAVSNLWDLSISGNPSLPACQANAVRDHLLAKGFTGTSNVTDNLGTCPP
jgi:hypothetical protein